MATSSSLLPLPWQSVLLILCFFLCSVQSDFASERAECTNQLIGLSTCLTYVQGQSGTASPTPDCCSAFQQVVSKSLKCVCVLVKERNNPQLGFKIDVNRALTLPSKCNVQANPGECPRLLNLPPNSTEAKVFEQFANQLKGRSPSSNAKQNSTVSGQDSMHASGGRRARWPPMKIFSWLWLISSLLLVINS